MESPRVCHERAAKAVRQMPTGTPESELDRTYDNALSTTFHRCEGCGDAPCSMTCEVCGCPCTDEHDRRCPRAPGREDAAEQDRRDFEFDHRVETDQ